MSKITIKKFRGINRDGDSPDMPIETFQDMKNWDIDKTTQQLVCRRPFYPYTAINPADINGNRNNIFIGLQNALLTLHFDIHKCIKYTVGVAQVQHNTMCIFKSKKPINNGDTRNSYEPTAPNNPDRYYWVVIDNGPFGGDGYPFTIVSKDEFLIAGQAQTFYPSSPTDAAGVLTGTFCEPVVVSGNVRLYMGPTDDYWIWMPHETTNYFKLLNTLEPWAIANNQVIATNGKYSIEDIVNTHKGNLFIESTNRAMLNGTDEAVTKGFLLIRGKLYHNSETQSYTNGIKKFQALAKRDNTREALPKGKYSFKISPLFDQSPIEYGAPIGTTQTEIFVDPELKQSTDNIADGTRLSAANRGNIFKIVRGTAGNIPVWTLMQGTWESNKAKIWHRVYASLASLNNDSYYFADPDLCTQEIPGETFGSSQILVDVAPGTASTIALGDTFSADVTIAYNVGLTQDTYRRHQTYTGVTFTCTKIRPNGIREFEYTMVGRVKDKNLYYSVYDPLISRNINEGEEFSYEARGETLQVIDQTTGTAIVSRGLDTLLIRDDTTGNSFINFYTIDGEIANTSGDEDIQQHIVLQNVNGTYTEMTQAPDAAFSSDIPIISEWYGRPKDRQTENYTEWYKMYWDAAIINMKEQFIGETITVNIEIPVTGFNPRVRSYGLFLKRDLDGAFEETDYTLIKELSVFDNIWYYINSTNYPDFVTYSFTFNNTSYATLGFWSQLYGTDGRGFRPFDHTEADITRKLGLVVHRRDRMIGTRIEGDEGQELMARTPIANGMAQLDVWFKPLLLNRGHGQQNNYLVELNDRILIFQDHDLIQMTVGESNRASDYMFQSTGGGIGTQIIKSVAKSNNAVFFANYDGIFKFTGSKPIDISLGSWNDYWRYSISKEHKDASFGAYNPKTNEYWLFVPGDWDDITSTYNREPLIWIWDDDPNLGQNWRTYSLDQRESIYADKYSIPLSFIADRDNNWIFVDSENFLYFWKGEEITPNSSDQYSWPVPPIKLALETQNLGERVADILPDRIQLIREDVVKNRTTVTVIRNNNDSDVEIIGIPEYYIHLPRRVKRRRSTTVRLAIEMEDSIEDIYYLDGADLIQSANPGTWKRPKLREITLYFISDRKRP